LLSVYKVHIVVYTMHFYQVIYLKSVPTIMHDIMVFQSAYKIKLYSGVFWWWPPKHIRESSPYYKNCLFWLTDFIMRCEICVDVVYVAYVFVCICAVEADFINELCWIKFLTLAATSGGRMASKPVLRRPSFSSSSENWLPLKSVSIMIYLPVIAGESLRIFYLI